MSIALLDGDVIAYQAAVSAEEDIDWGDGEEGKTVNVEKALSAARHQIREWLQLSGCRVPVVCLSPRDGSNFRKSLLPSYKSGRREKPGAYWQVVDMIENEFRVQRIPGLEADDVMGIMATSPNLSKPVVVSPDKDIQTIPALILRVGKMQRPIPNRQSEADRFWMFQTLTGDPTDGYKGCPKVGEVKAKAALSHARTLEQMWRIVLEIYEAKGLDADFAINQARMARILRREDYDKEKERIKLWHPTKAEWLDLTRISTQSANQPTTTSEEASSQLTSSSRTTSTTRRGTSSNTSTVRRSKGRVSRTSRKRVSTSTD